MRTLFTFSTTFRHGVLKMDPLYVTPFVTDYNFLQKDEDPRSNNFEKINVCVILDLEIVQKTLYKHNVMR